tara:strand:- start:13752 stop:13994 length:243 start_codon:yes stop_codon:yes gene_type:complete
MVFCIRDPGLVGELGIDPTHDRGGFSKNGVFRMSDIDGLFPDIRLTGNPSTFLKVFLASVADLRGIEKLHATRIAFVGDS